MRKCSYNLIFYNKKLNNLGINQKKFKGNIEFSLITVNFYNLFHSYAGINYPRKEYKFSYLKHQNKLNLVKEITFDELEKSLTKEYKDSKSFKNISFNSHLENNNFLSLDDSIFLNKNLRNKRFKVLNDYFLKIFSSDRKESCSNSIHDLRKIINKRIIYIETLLRKEKLEYNVITSFWYYLIVLNKIYLNSSSYEYKVFVSSLIDGETYKRIILLAYEVKLLIASKFPLQYISLSVLTDVLIMKLFEMLTFAYKLSYLYQSKELCDIFIKSIIVKSKINKQIQLFSKRINSKKISSLNSIYNYPLVPSSLNISRQLLIFWRNGLSYSTLKKDPLWWIKGAEIWIYRNKTSFKTITNLLRLGETTFNESTPEKIKSSYYDNLQKIAFILFRYQFDRILLSNNLNELSTLISRIKNFNKISYSTQEKLLFDYLYKALERDQLLSAQLILNSLLLIINKNANKKNSTDSQMKELKELSKTIQTGINNSNEIQYQKGLKLKKINSQNIIYEEIVSIGNLEEILQDQKKLLQFLRGLLLLTKNKRGTAPLNRFCLRLIILIENFISSNFATDKLPAIQNYQLKPNDIHRAIRWLSIRYPDLGLLFFQIMRTLKNNSHEALDILTLKALSYLDSTDYITILENICQVGSEELVREILKLIQVDNIVWNTQIFNSLLKFCIYSEQYSRARSFYSSMIQNSILRNGQTYEILWNIFYLSHLKNRSSEDKGENLLPFSAIELIRDMCLENRNLNVTYKPALFLEIFNILISLNLYAHSAALFEIFACAFSYKADKEFYKEVINVLLENTNIFGSSNLPDSALEIPIEERRREFELVCYKIETDLRNGKRAVWQDMVHLCFYASDLSTHEFQNLYNSARTGYGVEMIMNER